MKEGNLQLGFLASHNGTDMRGVIQAIDDNILPAQARVVISNNVDSPALEYAREHNIPALHISDKNSGSPENTDSMIKKSLEDHGVNTVILSGYMRKIGPITLAAFPNRIINVHPALLPNYAGLYGDSVHEAVLKNGDEITGVTLHSIDAEYDQGLTLLQKEVVVFETDSVESLRKRVQEEEVKALIELLSSDFH